MNKAIEVLTREHLNIKQALTKTQAVFDSVLAGEAAPGTLKDRILFFREYADGYHHHKEERVLFPEMLRRNEMLEFGVIHEMLQHHEDFREMLAGIEKRMDDGLMAEARQQFNAYAGALLEHIAVEDDEVFQIAETLLSEDELLSVFYRFEDCDRELGLNEKRELEKTHFA